MNFHLINVLWGNAFCRQFLTYSLPTQLSPRNLPLLAKMSCADYTLYTTERDAVTLSESVSFRHLAGIMKVTVAHIARDAEEIREKEARGEDKYMLMGGCHREAIANLERGSDDAFVFLSPDLLLADGGFGKLLEVAETGKRAVMVSGLRVAHTILPFLESYRSGACLSVPAREMVKLAIPNLHKLTTCMNWKDHEICSWPSLLNWQVGGGGMLVRPFHLHPLMVRPGGDRTVPAGTVDDDYIARLGFGLDEIHVVDDSDDIFFLDISGPTAPQLDVLHCESPEKYAAIWAVAHTNRFHRHYLRSTIRIHAESVSELWAPVQEKSDRVVGRILAGIKNSVEAAGHSPAVSVIVYHKGELRALIETLAAIRMVDYSNFEILLACDGSRPRVPEEFLRILRDRASVRILDCTGARGSAQCVGHALAQARGSYVHLLRAGVLPFNDIYKRCIPLLLVDRETPVCVVRSVELKPGEKTGVDPAPWRSGAATDYYEPAQIVAMLLKTPFAGAVRFGAPGSRIFKREALADIGGLNAALGARAEDFACQLLAFRHGMLYLNEFQCARHQMGDGCLPETADEAREAIRGKLRLLEDPGLSDVRRYFEITSALSENPRDVFSVLLEKPEYFSYLSPSLLRSVDLTDCMWGTMAATFSSRPEIRSELEAAASRTTYPDAVRRWLTTGFRSGSIAESLLPRVAGLGEGR